jgi:hypothetical protein
MKLIDKLLRDYKEKLHDRESKRGPPVNTVVLGDMSLVDCCDEDGNIPLNDPEAMIKNYIANEFGIDPKYCCEKSGKLPRLLGGGIDLDTIRERAHDHLQYTLSPGYVPKED